MGDPASEIWGRGDYRKIAADHQIMCERLCEHLCVSPAHRVLDVACGTGNSSIAAARRRASVVGIDFAPVLLEAARKRVEAEGMSGVEFVEADMRELPFDDASFDIVISTLGATFAADHEAMAKELARVTKPGGRIALTAYARHSLPSDVYDITADIKPPPPGSGPPAYVWTDGPYAREMFGSLCSNVEIHDGQYEGCFASAEAFFNHNMLYYAPMITRYNQLSSEQQGEYRERVMAAMQSWNRATDGSLAVRFNYSTIIATRAS